MPKDIKLTLSADDAENLSGLLEGCIGTSDSDDFNEFAQPILAQITKKLEYFYSKNKTSFKERNNTIYRI